MLISLKYHKLGVKGYIKFALEIFFKNKLVCLDLDKKKFKYINENGDIVIDKKLQKLFTVLAKSISLKSFMLSQEHYEYLVEQGIQKQN